MNWFNKLKDSITKKSDILSSKIVGIFKNKKISLDRLEDLEDMLIQADLGIEFVDKIITTIKKRKFSPDISSDDLKRELANEIIILLQKTSKSDEINVPTKVVLVCGVNGNGKTTTIGKLAHLYKEQGKKVMLAACDTFRAAAVDQLGIWAERCGVDFIKGDHGSDPASVAFRSFSEAKAKHIDVLLIDTAGRLQNKTNLMDELTKISRVLSKIDSNAPHEVLLVIDATTGQNAHSQFQEFNKVVGISGIIVTKLDGSAKAGVVLSLMYKYQVPIYAIGLGEGINDMQSFELSQYVNNLIGL